LRVLHLIEPGAPGGGGCVLRLLAEPLARLRSVEQDVIILGTRAHADLAARCGVDVTGVLTPPVGHAALARRALTRTMRIYERAHGRYDVIHAWTPQSAMLATMAAADHPRLATFNVGPVSGFTTQLLMMLLEEHGMPLMVASSAVEREFRSLGVRPDLLSVLPPAINPESVDLTDRAELRRQWEVDDQTFVIGLLSEPVNWADARTAMNIAARVTATGRTVRLVMHHGATRRAEAERWAARHGHRDLMIVDDAVAEPWRVVRGLDAALVIGGELNSMDLSGTGSPFAMLTGGGRRLRPLPGLLPLLWVMSAGVPVIAEASDAVSDVIEDGQNGLLVGAGDMNAVCDRIIRIYDDPTIAGRIGMQARRCVQERFHVSAYCVRLKEAYERLAGVPNAASPRAEPALVDVR